MLRREDFMCREGLLCPWQAIETRAPRPEPWKFKSQGGGGGEPRRGCRAGWQRRRGSGRGRPPYKRSHCGPQHHRPLRPRVLSLRPVNMMGNRAPGMRAPRNTNQFLMHEKYQLMHLRSDSVGTESGSDCEMDPLDMDSYLGVLENARGALLDCTDSPPDAGGAEPGQHRRRRLQRFFGALPKPQDDSMQYFPSEDDVIESENFMERDFHDFWSKIT